MRGLVSMALAAAVAAQPVQSLDLARCFATRSPWRLTVTPGAPIADPIMGDGTVPGPLTLCLSRDGGRTCDPQLGTSLQVAAADDLYATPHELRRIGVVHPRPDRPLLLVQLASLHSVNGDQRVGTEIYGYDRASDRFRVVYRYRTNRNNNQEVRYIDAGPLAGAVIAAEPTADAPFGFWITVARLGATGVYAQVLRYRSATRYGDGNPLAVIDSEMPALQQRLGLWRLGRPLPTPPHCAAPRLVEMELWCSAPPTLR